MALPDTRGTGTETGRTARSLRPDGRKNIGAIALRDLIWFTAIVEFMVKLPVVQGTGGAPGTVFVTLTTMQRETCQSDSEGDDRHRFMAKVQGA